MLFFLNMMMNVAVIWTNDVVHIPLGDNLDNYKHHPQATLYLNDEEVTDRLMYYEYELHYTSFNVIRTHIVGSYTVWYRAHFPTLGFESDMAITFVVYDHIAPSILGQNDVYVDVGTKSIDYKTLIEYDDNYDDVKDLSLTIDSNQVRLNQIGVYPVTYIVRDKAKNEQIFIQNIHVVDTIKPTIKQKSQIQIPVGTTLNIDTYFTFSDNYDNVLKTTLEDNLVLYQIPGIYPATLKVKDQSNNETVLNFNVTIIDQEGPKIILKTNRITLPYQYVLTDEELMDYIVIIEDNLDIILKSDVTIINYVDTNFLGNYQIIFEATDSSGLKGSSTLQVDVVDNSPPTVMLKEPIIVDVYSLEPFIYDYLIIEDNYDPFEKLTLSKTGTVSMNKVGEYRVIVKVVDQAKNSTEVPVIVQVVDKVAPVLNIKNELVITNFMRPDFNALIEVSDNYDKESDITIHIDDSHITYEKIGVHQIKITATDLSGNATTKIVHIALIDTSYPEIILKTGAVYLPYGIETIDYLSYVEDIYDVYDKDLSINDITITSSVDFTKIGLYEVSYEITDASNHTGKSLLYIYISDYEKPVITATPITIHAGEHFNYFEYVKAEDNYDGDITHLVKMNPQFIPLHQVGYYEVVFYVHDSSGNYSEIKVLLTIKKANSMYDYIYYIAGGIILIFVVTIYYVYLKKREKL